MNISAFNRRFAALYKLIALFTCLIFPVAHSALAMNSASEQRWAEQLQDNIVIGDPIQLTLASAQDAAQKNSFLAIYSEHTTAKPKGAVILLHGNGAHPDWSDIIHSLRTELPDRGWATLSIQMPLLLPDKQDEQSRIQVIEAATARIDAAIAYLKSKQYQSLSIIAHSFGALMCLNYLQNKAEDQPDIQSAIIIGTPSSGSSAPLNSPLMIEKIHIPLLDLYGSKDRDSVRRSAKARQAAANKVPNKYYRQMQTIGANHFYQGLEQELIRDTSHWLNKMRSLQK